MQQLGRVEQTNDCKPRVGKTSRSRCSPLGKVSSRHCSCCRLTFEFLHSQCSPFALRVLFWTDVGVRPSVERASLGGEGRVIIANTDLLWPSGLAIDFTVERLFWCDQRRGVVESAALDGSDRQVLLDKQVGEVWVTHTPTHTRVYLAYMQSFCITGMPTSKTRLKKTKRAVCFPV